MDIPEIIEGPAIIKYGTSYFESKEDISLKLTDESDDISTISRGTIAKRVKSRKIEMSFTPVKWSDYSTLFSVLNLTRGSRVFGSTNTATEIYGADGTKVKLFRTGITGISNIGLGVSKDRFSSFTLTGLADPTATGSAWSQFMAISTETMPSLPTLTSADLSLCAFIGKLVENSEDSTADDILFDLKEGAELGFDLKLNERTVDRLGLFDYTFDMVSPQATFEPVGLSVATWQKLSALTYAPNLGGVFVSPYDLVLCGLNEGEPQFELNSVVCADRELKWSATESRYSDLTLEAMGSLGINKFTVGTVEDSED